MAKKNWRRISIVTIEKRKKAYWVNILLPLPSQRVLKAILVVVALGFTWRVGLIDLEIAKEVIRFLLTGT